MNIIMQEKLMNGSRQESSYMFIPPNDYGYTTNLQHPVIEREYREYRRKIGEALFPLSDEQRLEFDRRMREKYSEEYWEEAQDASR